MSPPPASTTAAPVAARARLLPGPVPPPVAGAAVGVAAAGPPDVTVTLIGIVPFAVDAPVPVGVAVPVDGALKPTRAIAARADNAPAARPDRPIARTARQLILHDRSKLRSHF